MTNGEIEDCFNFFGASLIDCHEHLFIGGENQIAELSHNFYKAYLLFLENRKGQGQDTFVLNEQSNDSEVSCNEGV